MRIRRDEYYNMIPIHNRLSTEKRLRIDARSYIEAIRLIIIDIRV